MKKTILTFACLVVVFAFAPAVLAKPNNESKAQNNPQVVAYYEFGLHAIPGEPIQYLLGTNLVQKRGNSGQIQAWYTGEDGHGFHSVWNNSKDGTCSNGEILIVDAYPSWGDYLTPDQDYCVKVNAF